MTINRILTAAGAAAVGLTMATSAMAIPKLQLFIEGADYETAAENPSDPETWAKLGTTSFRLWVLGDTSSTYRIRDVKFVASYADGLTPGLAFTPTTTSGHGFTDTTTPVAVSGPFASPFTDFDTDAENWSTPTGPMGAHGMLTAGRTAKEWNLGMFELVDSQLGDSQPGVAVEASDNWFPTPSSGFEGQINVYNVLVSGLPVGAQVHFDVYGRVQEYKCISSCTGHSSSPVYGWADAFDGPNPVYVNAPFSHDARWEEIASIPEPASVSLFGAGLLGIGYFGRRRRAA